MEERWWELPPGDKRRASPIWNGGRIWGYHKWQVVVSPVTKRPGLEEAGAAWHEKEDGHQARKPQQKFPQTSEKQ